MSTFVVLLIVILSLVVGGSLSVIFMQRRAQDQFSKYEQTIAEQEHRRAELAAAVRDELLDVRNGIVRAASAYENIVNVVERELGVKEDLHIFPALPNTTKNALPIYMDQNAAAPVAAEKKEATESTESYIFGTSDAQEYGNDDDINDELVGNE